MKVYIVVHGELSEGGKVMGVHVNYSDAKIEATLIPTHFKSPWEAVKDERDFWVSGCDFVEIVEQELQGYEG